MDLRLMVWGAGIIVGLALVLAGWRVLRPRAGNADSRRPQGSSSMPATGAAFLAGGAALAVFCVLRLASAWVDTGEKPFPMPVLNLNAPAEPIRSAPASAPAP